MVSGHAPLVDRLDEGLVRGADHLCHEARKMGSRQVVHIGHLRFRGCTRRKRSAVNGSLRISQDSCEVFIANPVVNTPIEAPAPDFQFTVSSGHQVKDCMAAFIHGEHANALKWRDVGYQLLRYQTSPDDVTDVTRLMAREQSPSPQ